MVDLSEATFVDADGQKRLARMHRRGATLHACGCLNRSIVEQIERLTASNESHPTGA